MKYRFIISALLLLGFYSCKTTKNHPVPSLPFNVELNLNLPSYNSLQGVGGYCYSTGGVKGLVVYRKGVSEFVAFDRMATTDNANDCATGITINPDNFLVLDDPCSDVQYSLFDGSVLNKGAKYGLRSYFIQYDGNSVLRIYNP